MPRESPIPQPKPQKSQNYLSNPKFAKRGSLRRKPRQCRSHQQRLPKQKWSRLSKKAVHMSKLYKKKKFMQ